MELEPNKRYKKYDQSVKEYMCALFSELTETYGEVRPGWISSLDLIAFNLDIIKKAQLDYLKNGLDKIDDRGRLSRNMNIPVASQAQGNLMKLLSSFGLSPLAKSKIKDLPDVDDPLEDLLGE